MLFSRQATLDSTVLKIEGCKSADEVLRVANACVREVQSINTAVTALRGPMPINSADDLRAWLRELKAVARPEVPKEAVDLFAHLFSCLRAVERRLEVIDSRHLDRM